MRAQPGDYSVHLGAPRVVCPSVRSVVLGRTRYRVETYRADRARRETVCRVRLSGRWTTGFLVYQDVVACFPLTRAARDRVSFYARAFDPADPRVLEGDRRRGGPEGSWYDIRGYANLAAFHDGRGRALAILHRGRSERQRLDIVNNRGRQFTFRLRTRAPGAGSWPEELELAAYTPSSRRFWWQDAVEYAAHTGVPLRTARIAVAPLSGASAPRLFVLGCRGRPCRLTVRSRLRLDARPLGRPAAFRPRGPVHGQALTLPAASGVYQVTVQSSAHVLSALCIRRPPRGRPGDILYVLPTNAWRSYAMNGHYHGIEHGFPWSYSYSAQLMEGISDPQDDVPPSFRYPPQTHYYNNMPSGFMRLDAGPLDAVSRFAAGHGLRLACCGEEDLDSGAVAPASYRLVILGNHAEYSTERELQSLFGHLARGGALLVLGADAFGRRVDYLRDRRGHLLYQPLYRSSIIGYYPRSAQRSPAARLRRFGLCEHATIPPLKKQWLTITDVDHPITRDYQLHEPITETCWETDRVAPGWKVLAGVWYPPERTVLPALALHPARPCAYVGPMGIGETLAGFYGDRGKLYGLLARVLDYLLRAGRPTARSPR